MALARLALAWLLAPAALALEARLPRDPAPSPDGTRIAFSWQGDLWLVDAGGGPARRLTAHPGFDHAPVWSRDGRYLAFASNRNGNDDVYLVPSDLSEAPRRLTYASSDDLPRDFTPDGEAVLFTSRRDDSPLRTPGLYEVPVTGGTAAAALNALALDAAYSPGGRELAFERGATPWWRRGYRGSGRRSVWLRDAQGELRPLGDRFEGDESLGGWVDGHTLLVLSSRSPRKNLVLLDTRTGDTRPLTRHEGTDVRAPRVSADGRLAAYEFEDGLWAVATAGGEPRRIAVQVAADEALDPVERKVARDGASELAVSGDGKLAALVVRGDVFVTEIRSKEDQEIAEPPTVRVTDTPARERDIDWAPDGKSILVCSDRDGTRDLFLLEPAGDGTWTESFAFKATAWAAGPEEEHRGRFSPDGKRIAFLRGNGNLVVRGREAGAEERVLLRHWGEVDFDWSPDGKWIAYSTVDMDFNSEVWIVPAEGGEPYNVSRHPDEDSSPRWSPDGRRLVWVTRRHGDTGDVWGVWLAKQDHERTAEDWFKLWKAEEDKEKKEKGKGKPAKPARAGKAASSAPARKLRTPDAEAALEPAGKEASGEDAEKKEPRLPAVTVDFEGLWERGQALTELSGEELSPLVSRDGKRVLFSADTEGKRDLYAVRWDGKELKRLTEGGKEPSALQLDREGKTAYFLNKKGAVERVTLEGKAGDPIPFQARYQIDRAAERRQVFDEAWRVFGESFYDPAFHGVDWKAMRERYRPWALAASHPETFADVVRLMLGELNASHTGYYLASPGSGGEKTGWIGARFDPQAGGPGLLVWDVVPDSPAATLEVKLAAGERLLEVDGEAVGPDRDVHERFTDTEGRKVRLRIQGRDGATREATVIPVDLGALRQLVYRRWVKERRAIVEDRSRGRLGYLHIQGMSIPSFEEFERDLYAAAHGKEGLLIDVRNNGGGWTTDYLMAVLNVKRHARTVPRGADPSVKAYPQERLRLASWTRPALTLCNQESFSNAEIFSWAFQTLGRGKVVGVPTFGGVISTGAALLVDGSRIRLPFRGWYVAGSDLNMENNGFQPDVVVEQPPEQDRSPDRDAQLERAVEVFLEGIEEDPRYRSW